MATDHHRLSSRGLAVCIAVATLLLTPATAWGHAALLESRPGPGERLNTGPGEIQLQFTEPLNRSLSKASLVNLDTGKTVPARTAAGSDKELVLQPQAGLSKAPYRVDWQTVSTVDGHTLTGSLSFGVQTAAVGSEHSIEQSPLARDGWLRIGARAILYAALFLFAGGVLNAVLLARGRPPGAWLVPESVHPALRRAGRDPDQVAEAVWRRTLDAGWLAAAAAVFVAVAEAFDAAGGLSVQGLNDFLLANGAGMARIGTVVALLVAVLLAGARMRYAASVAVTLAFLTISLSGHANSAEQRSLAVVTDWLHLNAAAIWAGGIVQIAWAWLPVVGGLDPVARLEVMRSVLARFGRVALPAFLAVAASGLANALIELGHPEALWQTAYGRVLAFKITLVGLIALASYAHALRLRPALLAANPHPSERLERRHWRLLGVEPWLGLGAIVAVAALVAFPLPPRQLGESDEAAASACSPCPLPEARSDELPVAEQAGSKIAAFWLRREGDQLSGTLRVVDYNSTPVDTEVEVEGAEPESCGLGCWRFSVPVPGRELTADVTDRGRQYRVRVPSRWDGSRTRQAERLMRQSQAGMRRLNTMRMRESLTSGIGGVVVNTRYRFQAPDRIAYTTSTGATRIGIGKVAYDSTKGGPFKKGIFGADGFHLDEYFRWTVYGRTVRWLGREGNGVHIALFDRATPIWYRLDIDRSKLVRGERMIAGGHFMTQRYSAFNRPFTIEPPR